MIDADVKKYLYRSELELLERNILPWKYKKVIKELLETIAKEREKGCGLSRELYKYEEGPWSYSVEYFLEGNK
jgi:hypothetical protein